MRCSPNCRKPARIPRMTCRRRTCGWRKSYLPASALTSGSRVSTAVPSSSLLPCATSIRKRVKAWLDIGMARCWLSGCRVEHLEVLEHLARIPLGGEIAGDHALEKNGEQIGAGVPRGKRMWNPCRIDAIGLREPKRLGHHAVVGQHQRLVDELGRLSRSDAAHVGEAAELLHHRPNDGDGSLVASGHDGERTRLRCGRAARHRRVHERHTAMRFEPGGKGAGGVDLGGGMIHQHTNARLGHAQDTLRSLNDVCHRVRRRHRHQCDIRALANLCR